MNAVTAELRDPIRRSPLGATGAEPLAIASADGIEVFERPFLAQVLLRLQPTSAARGRVERTAGFGLPEAPNRVGSTHGSARLAISLAPDEWLLIDGGDPSDLEARVRTAAGRDGATIVEVSAHRTLLEMRGPRVRDLLAAGTSVDVHPRAFAIGAAAQTIFARVDVIIGRGGEDVYHVAVRSSFAAYLAAWIRDALDGM
jgi:sarcosine oxidase subunit gamma